MLLFTIFTLLLGYTNAQRILTENDTEIPSSTALFLFLVLFILIGLFYFDRRNNFYLINSLRHKIGDIITRVRRYKRRFRSKQQKIETQEYVATPKPNIFQADNEKSFIQSQRSSAKQQAPIDPYAKSQAQLQQQGKSQVDLKNVFQVRESTKKQQKEKKSKSKLKNRIQTSTQQTQNVQNDNSFASEGDAEVQQRGNEVE